MRGLHREGALVGASQTAKGKVFMTTKAAQARNILGELDHRIGLDHYVEDRAFFWHELFFVQSIEEYLLFLWLEADDAEMQGDVALLQMKQRVATGSRGPLTAVSIVRPPHLPSPPQKKPLRRRATANHVMGEQEHSCDYIIHCRCSFLFGPQKRLPAGARPYRKRNGKL
jgi:hypothetical protein